MRSSAPIPALLALGAVHQHLIRLGLRTRVSLIVESGEPREVHHLACLVGMGAEAVNPYLALATVRALAVERDEIQRQGAVAAGSRGSRIWPTRPSRTTSTRWKRACSRSCRRWASPRWTAIAARRSSRRWAWMTRWSRAASPACRRGWAASASYRLAADVLDAPRCGLRHRRPPAADRASLPHPGFYKYKKEGEYHAFSPGRGPRAATGGERRGRLRGLPRLQRPRPQPPADRAARPARLLCRARARAAARRGGAGGGDRRGASRPPRCRTARSAARRTRRWRSR